MSLQSRAVTMTKQMIQIERFKEYFFQTGIVFSV